MSSSLEDLKLDEESSIGYVKERMCVVYLCPGVVGWLGYRLGTLLPGMA